MRSLPVATKPMMTVSFQSLSTLTTANDRGSWSPERSNNQLKWDRGGRRVKRAISESWGALTGDRTLTIRIITNVIAPTNVLKSASNRKKWKAQSFWLNYDSWFGALEVASSKSTRALIGESWGTDDYVITSEKKNVWKAKPKKIGERAVASSSFPRNFIPCTSFFSFQFNGWFETRKMSRFDGVIIIITHFPNAIEALNTYSTTRKSSLGRRIPLKLIWKVFGSYQLHRALESAPSNFESLRSFHPIFGPILSLTNKIS